MLESIKNRRAWITQRLANRFPPWSRIRKLAQSVGQQLLEPMGRDLEEVYWWANYNLGNYLLNSSDLQQLEGLSRLSLPITFEWRTYQYPDSVVYLAPTSIRGQLDGTWITLNQAQANSLEEFWYGIPTRIELSEDSFSYYPVLSSTLVADLSSGILVSPAQPGKLWITLSDNGNATKSYMGTKVKASVTLTGRDIHLREATEKVYFGFNGTVQTRLAWSEIYSIETSYIDSTASLRIDWLSVGQTEYLDFFGLNVCADREKFRFWYLDSRSFGSSLKQLVFSADDLTLVEEGHDYKHAIYETQLLDSAGSNINGVSLSPWPRRKFVIVTDGSYLHFYVPSPRVENMENISKATTEAVIQLELEKEYVTQGDTILIDYNMKRPFFRVLRTRLSVQKPDGTRVCITANGSEIPFSSSGWVEHLEGSIFRKLGYQENGISYTISDKGAYTFFLESIIADTLTTESQSRPIFHTDVRILSSSYDNALASLLLPVSVGTVNSIAFDSYQQPWVINGNGVAYKLEFHYDLYLADFQNKLLIFRESYSNIEVDA